MSIGSWIYLWAFYSVPLIYISVFVPVPYCLDDWAAAFFTQCIVGYSFASLASTHWMPGATPTAVTTGNVSTPWPVAPGKQSHPDLTVLVRGGTLSCVFNLILGVVCSHSVGSDSLLLRGR